MTIHPVQQPDGPEPLRCIADTIAKGKAKTNGTISGAAIPVLWSGTQYSASARVPSPTRLELCGPCKTAHETSSCTDRHDCKSSSIANPLGPFPAIREENGKAVSVHFSHTCLLRMRPRSVLTGKFAGEEDGDVERDRFTGALR